MSNRGPRSFLSAVFWNGAVMTVCWPLSVLTAVLVGRILGPTGKGEYTLAMLAGTLLFTIFNLGVPSSISYYLAGRRAPESSLVKTVVTLGMILSALGIGLAFLLHYAGWSSYVLGVPSLSRTTRLVVLTLPFQFLGTFLQFTVLGQGHRVLFAAAPALGQIAGGILIVALAWGGKLTPFSAVGSQVASQALAACILLVYEQIRVRWVKAPFVTSEVLKKLSFYSAWTYIANTFQFLVQRIDVFLVSALLDLRAVGIYSVAYGTAELLLLLPQRLGVLYLPRVAGEQTGMNKADEVRLSSSLVFLGSVLMVVVLALIAPPAIRLLYGQAFAPAVTPFLILLPGICALATASIQAAYLAGMDRVATNAAVSGCGLALNVLLNLILIPRYGVSGAALASSLTYCAQAMWLAHAVAQITKAKPLKMFTSASPDLIANILRRVLRPKPVC